MSFFRASPRSAPACAGGVTNRWHAAMTWGIVPRRPWERSAATVTSRPQGDVCSSCQCPRTRTSQHAGGRAGGIVCCTRWYNFDYAGQNWPKNGQTFVKILSVPWNIDSDNRRQRPRPVGCRSRHTYGPSHPPGGDIMKVKTQVKAGGLKSNHNRCLASLICGNRRARGTISACGRR
jgi:hypothetical protein